MASGEAKTHDVLECTDKDYEFLGIKPTEIWLEHYGDHCTVIVPALGEYGHGKDISAAFEDLSLGIEWFYKFLLSQEKYLTQGLADDLVRFRAVMREVER